MSRKVGCQIGNINFEARSCNNVDTDLGGVQSRESLMMPCDSLVGVNLGEASSPRIVFISSSMNKELFNSIKATLEEFKDCFAWDYTEMPGLDRRLVEHKLPIKTGFKPVQQAPRRMTHEVTQAVFEEVKKLFKAGYIRTSRYTEWISSIVPVIKKNGKIRVCIDFRDLNRATPKDEYPMPIADDLVDKTAGHQIMTFMDGFSGYNQIFLAEEDIHKTAFRCPLGIFEWVVMPFGLKNAGATYQRAMNAIFDALISKTVEVYIDDIVVKSQDEKSHVNDLRNAFIQMRKHQLKLNPLNTCVFFRF
ncbi:hypothetical protein MLD38_018615 [Melastoma candidum]|nr:hypothetical protein MLD38_018615 [Melastoma candidum]